MKPTMGEDTRLQSRKRKWVVLADNLQKNLGSGRAIVIGDCVSDLTIGRSGLLEGIEETDGLAALPPNVTSMDFKLWETAQFVEEDLPLDDLVTVVKVADAVGDTNVTSWLQKLKVLIQGSGKSFMYKSFREDESVCSLLRLPAHLLHPVLANALSLTGSSHFDLEAALQKLPTALHHDIVAAAAASSGELTFGHSEADKVLLLLPGMSMPSSGLLTVNIVPSLGSDAEICAFCSNPSTGASLARSLSAQPSLTRLSLSSTTLTPQWLRSFSNCLAPAALPHLASLSLAAAAHPGGCAQVAACLRSLPALSSLEVSLSIHDCSSSSATRSLSTYARLAGNRVLLPHLQHLKYVDGAAKCPAMCGRHLWQLKPTASDSCAPSFLSLLHAPALTTLEFELASRLQLHAFQALQRQVARLTSLHEISITAVNLPESPQAIAAAARLPRLELLRDLALTSPCAASLVAGAASFAELAPDTLEAMELIHDTAICIGESVHDFDLTTQRNADAEAVGHAYSRMFAALGRFTGLKDLCLEGLHAPPLPGEVSFSEAMIGTLKQVTQLTYLKLALAHGADLELDGGALGSAVSAMSGLQRLSLGSSGSELTVNPVPVFLDACAHLQHATYLGLKFQSLTPALISGLLPKLPSLKELQLQKRVVDDAAPGALDALQARFSTVAVTFDT